MKRVCLINVVGLTPRLLAHAPHISKIGEARPIRAPWPAVTSTSQATMLTGRTPAQHGIVGNGWYYRDTYEIRFWQQSNALVQGEKLYDDRRIATAKMFWWFNQGAAVDWSATPKPHYGCDGSKVFDILDQTGCDLVRHLGPFPFFAFWGPKAGLPSSRWIADATALVMKQRQPDLTLAYLPHLDYDYQRSARQDPRRVEEVDACAATILQAAEAIDAQPVVVSEYGLTPVHRPVMINRELRRAGWLTVRQGPFGEMLMPMDSRAFAVVDHQLAHVYVRDIRLEEVKARLEAVPGIDKVVHPAELQLDHRRAGELVALAEPDAWFVYYYWERERDAPDFAPTVDIHRKPGYDPCELFMTSPTRAMLRLAQKKLGFRYRMDVIPLNPTLVRGSHGLQPSHPDDGAVIVGPQPPADMGDVCDYIRNLLELS